ncbi:MAG TPA: sugar kinase [Pyrinomonadaceae bacterium]|nr:sugar kinase [Pyrinomonadaceae bacterium]
MQRKIRVKEESRFDLVALGEILLRFDPGEMRIRHAREFQIWDGGAEYNVAANMSRVFGQRSAILTALADNEIGRLAAGMAAAAGVDTSKIIWRNPGSGLRNGIYFIERGHGLRAPASAFDRANTAVSELKAGDIDWQVFFDREPTRWFHTGGVFTGLSETTPDTAIAAMRAARESGCIVSYDLNYRESLWAGRGGRVAADEVNRAVLPFADVVFGTFGFDATLSNYADASFRSACDVMRSHFPNLQIIVSSLRNVHSASCHDLAGVCSVDSEIFRSADLSGVDVLDRVGSGDAFASGFIYAMLEGRDPQFAIDCAAAHGALSLTTPGDCSLAGLDDVMGLMQGKNAAAVR